MARSIAKWRARLQSRRHPKRPAASLGSRRHPQSKCSTACARRSAAAEAAPRALQRGFWPARGNQAKHWPSPTPRHAILGLELDYRLGGCLLFPAGEAIVGSVALATMASTIHRQECANVTRSPGRPLPVHWNPKPEPQRRRYPPCSCAMKVLDRVGVLQEHPHRLYRHAAIKRQATPRGAAPLRQTRLPSDLKVELLSAGHCASTIDQSARWPTCSTLRNRIAEGSSGFLRRGCPPPLPPPFFEALPLEPAIEGLGVNYWMWWRRAFPLTRLRCSATTSCLRQLGIRSAAVKRCRSGRRPNGRSSAHAAAGPALHAINSTTTTPARDGRGFSYGELLDRHGPPPAWAARAPPAHALERGGERHASTLKGRRSES